MTADATPARDDPAGTGGGRGCFNQGKISGMGLWIVVEFNAKGEFVSLHGPFPDRWTANVWIGDDRDKMTATQVDRIVAFPDNPDGTEAQLKQMALQERIDGDR